MRRIFKKGLSVFLSLLMVMSSFAMITPDMFMKAEAAAGNYDVQIKWLVDSDGDMNGNGGSISLHTAADNGTGSVTKQSEKSFPKTDTETVNAWNQTEFIWTDVGFPSKFTMSLTNTILARTFSATVYVYVRKAGTTTWSNAVGSYHIDEWGDNTTNDGTFSITNAPVATTFSWSNTPEDMTCPKTDSVSQSVAVTAYDQFGVQMYNPTWSVKGSLCGTTGISVTTGNNAASGTNIQLTNGANVASDVDKQEGTVTATWGSKSDSKKFDIYDTTYTVSFKYKVQESEFAPKDETNTQNIYHGDSVTIPEIPQYYSLDDYDYDFVAWEPSVETVVTSDKNYVANYDEKNKHFVSADYTGVDEIKALVQAEKDSLGLAKFNAKYTLATLAALETAISNSLIDYPLGRTKQSIVDGYAVAIEDAYRALEPNRYDVIFLDKNGAILKYEKNAEFENSVEAPTFPEDQKLYYDADKHYTYTGWNSDEYTSVIDDLVIAPVYTEAEHDWETETVTSTCVQAGTTKYTCKVCGYVKYDGGDQYGDHVWEDDFTVDLEPTCVLEGSKSIHCSLCDAQKDITTIPAKGHNWGDFAVAVSPTCDTAGVSTRVCAEEDCKFCQHLMIDPLGHDYKKTTVPATCTEKGYDEYVCQRDGCDSSYRDNFTDTTAPHTYGAWETVSEAYCGISGVKKQTCEVCGHINLDTIPALEHDALDSLEWNVIIAPSCEGKGYQEKICSKCNQVIASEEIAPAGHTPETETKAPNCTEAGYENEVCSVCGEILSSTVIDPTGHDYEGGTEVIQKEATCTEDGLKYITCKNSCGIAKEVIIPKTLHTWGDWTVIPSTNTSKGSVSRECTKCGEIETVEIPEGNHNMVKDEAASKAPTCKEEGVTVYKCADENCNVVLELEEPKLQHTVATEEEKATCTAEGYFRTYCSECGEELSKVITKKLAHVYVAGTPVAPTCTTSGYTPYECSNDGCTASYNMYEASQPATGHKFTGAGTVVTAATCTTDGVKKIECDVCDVETEVVIPKLGHNYELVSETVATCGAAATQTYDCSRCDATYTVSVGDKLTTHSFGNWTIVEQASNTSIGYRTRTCTVCGQIEVETIPATGEHIFDVLVSEDPATCTEAGERVYGCSTHKDCGLESTVTIPALGHTEELLYTPATCTGKGSIVTVCDVCNEILDTKVIDALGHAWGYEKVTPATCQAEGKIEYTCTRENCGETHKVVIPVDADAHQLETTVKDATCTEDGEVVTICKNEHCNYSKTETIAAKGHTIETTVTNPECEKDGEIVEKCKVCGTEKKTIIPALKHNYTDEVEVYKAPTCTEDGIKWVECANGVCDRTIEVVVPKLGHDYDEGTSIEATCKGGAYTLYKCKVCSHTEIRYVEGSTAISHNYFETIDRHPTCTAEGQKTVTCTAGCDISYTEAIPMLPHNWSDWTVTAPTHENKGSVSRECSVCHEKESVAIPAGDHKMVEDKAASTAPTCKEEGKTVYKCTDTTCDVVLELTEPKLQHTTATEEISATCTAEGYIRTYCSVCGEELADIVTIKKLAHVYVAGAAVAPTCTTSGYTPYTCACGDTYNKYDASQSATGHNYEEVANSSTAKCTTAGTKTLKCKDCVAEIEVNVPALGHDYVLDASASTDATCGAPATQTYKCSRCTAEYTISVGDKLTEHNYPEAWTTVKEATPTSIGYKTRACTVCGQIDVEEIPATGDHVFNILNKEKSKAPTCTEAGHETYNCSEHENCTYESTVTIPKLGHDEKLVYTAATCEGKGSVARHCNRCNVDLETKEIEALGHAWGNEVVTPATCQAEGKIEYTCTRGCGKTHTVKLAKDANAHNLETTVTEATCTTAGSVVTKCTNTGCTHVAFEEAIAAKGHTITTIVTAPKCDVDGTVIETCSECVYRKATTIPAPKHSYTGAVEVVKAPTCTEDGINKVACANIGCTSKTEVVVPKLGHKYGEGVKTDSDCTNGGYTKYTCTRTDCGYVHVELDGTTGSGHDFSGKETVIKEATCTEDGSKTVKCKDCDAETTVVIPKKGHVMGNWVQTKAPTCTEDGAQEKTCTNNCGEKITASVPKLGHEWGAWIVEKASTNTEAGQLKRTCARGCEETVDIPAGGHVLAVNNALSTDSTCTEEGEAVFTCTAHADCGVRAELVLDKAQHVVSTTIKEATCTADGYIKTYCSVCDKVFSDEPVYAVAHEYVAGTPVNATCTTSGYTPYTCACGDTYYEYDADAKATGHDYEEVEGSSTADCTTAGEMTLKCKVCDKEIKADVPALGHDYVLDTSASTDATCGAPATRTYKCSRCTASYTISVGDKLTTHNYPNTWTTVKEATPTSIGYKTRACTVCGQIDVEEIPATGDHVFDKLLSETPATCTATGEKKYGCSTHADCGLESTVTIPALGHDEKLVYTEATCEGEGSVARHCDRCDKDLETEAIAALGHAWGNETVVKATCKTAGKIAYSCTRCTATHEVEIPVDATAHSYTTTVTDATCTSTGSVVVTCGYCGESETTTIAQKGHIWKDDPESTSLATCTENGKEIYKCENCEATHEVVLPKLGHAWSDWTVVQPTATTDGSISRTCSRGCTESVVIPKGDHKMVEVSRDEATCTKAGKIVYKCEDKNCGIELEVVLNQLAHAINTVRLEPTCSKDGYIRETCGYGCGYTNETVLNATNNHTPGEWIVVDAPTCVNTGIRKRECIHCFGEDEFETIPATGEHTYVGNWQTVYAPTCESSGVEKDVCTVCKETSITRQTDPIGHKLVTVTYAATCEEDGKAITTCENGCDYRTETPVPKLGHDYEKTAETQATCTEAPTETWTCKNDASHTYTIITDVPNGHSYTGTVITQASCTAAEVTRYECNDCEESYDVITAVPNGHSYIDNWEEVKKATATENGQLVRYCTVCNAAPEYATVPATGAHVFEKGDYVAPDCTTKGSQAWVCTTHTDCDANYVETIPATGHQLVLDKKDASCTETGYVKLVCSVDDCGAELDSYEVPMLCHTYTEVAGSRQEASCTELGSYKTACTCGAEQTIAIPAKGHSYTTNSFAADCLRGARTVYRCACGDTYTITTSEPLGHDWGEWSETKAATATEAGILERECERNCGAKETAPLAPTGEHNFVKDTEASVEATCDTAGMLVFKCTAEHNCGVTFTHNVEAKGHQFGLDYKKATCTEDGHSILYCTVCGHIAENNIIDKLGHKYEAEVTTEAKCGEEGVVTYTCANCGDSYTENVPALEHSFIVEVAGTKVAPTCITDGKVTMKCYYCDATQEKVLGKTGHMFDEGTVLVKPDCVTAGKIEYTCQYDHTHKFTEVIEPTGSHTLVGEIVEYPATCVRPARNEQYCEACKNWVVVWESDVPASHTWNDWVVEKLPTQTEDGYQYRVCSVCGEIEEMILTAGRMFRVTFYNDNGERLTRPAEYTYGSKVERPEDPIKHETDVHTFEFLGWTYGGYEYENAEAEVAETKAMLDYLGYGFDFSKKPGDEGYETQEGYVKELALVAVYKKVEKTYKVTYIDGNGDEKIVENVKHSDITTAYNGVPVKDQTEVYTYTFREWQVVCSKDKMTGEYVATATAQFDKHVIPGQEDKVEKEPSIFMNFINSIINFFKNILAKIGIKL